MIEARSLAKVYWDAGRALEIFRDVTLTVEAGRVLAVVGPSGCGKTTLLNLLSGLDRPSAGEVIVRGQRLAGLSDDQLSRFRNRTMGFVFQSYHLLAEFTALENVMLPALIGGATRQHARTSACRRLAEVGLTERSEHYPSQLSGGESQRVAIARALVNDPSVLFCDEPTGNLDRARAAEIIELLARLTREGRKTAVWVTHDERAAAVADRVIDASASPWRESDRIRIVSVDAAVGE